MPTVPELVHGDRLCRDEFERRYSAMERSKKAELVEGVVYMPSPVSHSRHSAPHGRLLTWLGVYAAATPGVDFGDNATVRLDLENEVQPAALLRLARGGRSRLGPGGYLEGAPELAVEVTASSASYDLHDKFRAYQRNGVQEYLVWRVDEAAIDWFRLAGSRYERVEAVDGVLKSRAFAGLWLDVGAILRLELGEVLGVLARGTASREHAEFVAVMTAGGGEAAGSGCLRGDK